MGLVYSPSDDSYLLSDVLSREIPKIENFEGKKFLEIGVGSGIQLETLREIGVKNIYGVDINKDAVKTCLDKGFKCVRSDLFENVFEKYDVIIFNPPYLPKIEGEDEESRLITTGGEKGSEIINRFLREAEEYLNPDGKIYLVVSSLTKGLNLGKWKKRVVGEKKLFFEKLEVWELSL